MESTSTETDEFKCLQILNEKKTDKISFQRVNRIHTLSPGRVSLLLLEVQVRPGLRIYTWNKTDIQTEFSLILDIEGNTVIFVAE